MDFDRLLQTVVDSDASDLLLKAGSQPAMKTAGKVLFLADGALSDADVDSVLKRIASGEQPAFGRIVPGHAAYPSYRALLKRTLDEHYASLLAF